MSTEADINAEFRRWRLGIKRKMRGIASFFDRARMRFEVIEQAIFPRRVAIDGWQIRRFWLRDIGKIDWIDADYKPFAFGERWGEYNMSAHFRAKATVPPEFAGQDLVLRLYIGGDSLLYLDGEPFQGIDPFRYLAPLHGKGQAGRTYDLLLESFHSWHGGFNDAQHAFRMAELAVMDWDVHRAYWDLKCVEKALEIPDIDVALEEFLQTSVWEALKLVPLTPDDPSLRECILRAGERIRQTVYASDRFRGEGLQHLVGHSHLDVVYMWPHREFVRKVGRTHSTMLRLMERYPQFKFSQSQARLYADMKKHFPEMFEQVKQRIAEGRWEPIGAFWVEPDCNLVSGESFIRQIMHGQQFFQKEFGIRSRTCWQPDVFGLSWALPQILKRSGVEYLITNKMVPWNDTNEWRLHTFRWEGMDGSQVLGIVPPGHFIGTVDPDLMVTQWRNFSDRASVGETLHIYGWGDGGGGPDIEMLESAQRYGDFPGMVRTRFSTAEEAFDSIRKRVDSGAKIPTYRDEIYLEAHRGTYTTKGPLKKHNRRNELLLRDAEMLAALAWLGGAQYPYDAIHDAWETLLDTQFHDAIPGTHITEVYGLLIEDHQRIAASAAGVLGAAADRLLGPADASGSKLVVFNPAMHQRADVLAVPAGELAGRAVLGDDGKPLPQQAATDLEGNASVLVQVSAVPQVGYRTLSLGKAAAATGSGPAATPRSLENELLKVTFSDAGEITSIFDKENSREVLVAGQMANRFELFEDTPGTFQAWDIVDTFRDHPIDIAAPVSLSVDEQGPVRASLLLRRPCAGSHIRQRISLYAGDRRVVFETEIDWRERQRLLKVAFPVEINSRVATYDIAFGNMTRANHRNTPHDAARFEVPAHWWMDLSQGDYGVSLLNDCKYGHECDGKLIRLTLLKGPMYPDPESDKGTHRFTYALYPHAGDWRAANTIAKAAELNQPLTARAVAKAPASASKSYISCDSQGVTLEAVKRSEDGKDLIIRVVERHNTAARRKLTVAWPIASAWSCNLMEEDEQQLKPEASSVYFNLGPYEIKTLRLRIAR
jgi:alpha-mannosidase